MRSLLPLTLPLLACDPMAVAIDLWPMSYEPAEAASPKGQGVFSGKDQRRQKLPVRLVPMAIGLEQPTDIQFPPGRSDRMVVAQKGGVAAVFDLAADRFKPAGNLMSLDVRSGSEMGLLGLAFHPRFPDDPRIFANHNPKEGDRRTRISSFVVDTSTDAWTAGQEVVLLEVGQPYGNHDAGQIAFGPDGMLYIGLGDGGSAADPKDHGQNKATLLGSVLRIDVDQPGTEGRAYAVPADNPWVDDPAHKPEQFAIGLRNPWRISFDPQGRLIAADVGQNLYEEVGFVPSGGNLGWRLREARHCFNPKTDCPGPESGLTDPFYEYGRDEGQSITGGFTYGGTAIPGLVGHYVFGDFVSGRLWGVVPPSQIEANPPLAEAKALGQFSALISTFGQDAEGEIYLADFAAGAVFKLAAMP